jgi:hypothetical protein
MDTFWRLRQGFPPWPIEKPGDLLWPWDRVTLMFADNRVLAYPWPALYAALVIAGWPSSRAAIAPVPSS